MHYVANRGHDSTVELFLQHSSTSLNSPDNEGWTSLHLAVYSWSGLPVKILKAAGATILNLEDLSPTQIEKLQAPIPEYEILEIRHRIYFTQSLTSQLV